MPTVQNISTKKLAQKAIACLHAFSFVLIFSLILVISKKSLLQKSAFQNRSINKSLSGLPVRLTMPSINVDSKIQFLDVTQTGKKGSAVVADGMFIDLNKLFIINQYLYDLPVRLIIPSINVNAKIQALGVNQMGEMEVPDNIFEAGWFKFGPQPGEKGSAVIAGHLNGENGENGVFVDLYKLKKGDKLYIKNNKGITIAFIIRESRLFDPGYANDVFGQTDIAHLNLVTCDGVWDETIKSYTKRLVVFTDISTP